MFMNCKSCRYVTDNKTCKHPDRMKDNTNSQIENYEGICTKWTRPLPVKNVE